MIRRGYYGNGKLNWETILDDQGLWHGLQKRWWDNGQLYYEHPYHHGYFYGPRRGWYKNGQLMYEHPYCEGQFHGIVQAWYIDGRPKIKNYYLYGDPVSEEEYRRHELIKTLSGL